LKDKEIINIIQEQLINMFPNQIIHDLEGKSERLYKIMRLKESLPEIEKTKEVLKKLLREL
jgi:hypothetical protein